MASFVFASEHETEALNNPLSAEFGSFTDVLLAILNVLLIIAMPIIVLYLIYAGFQYVIARGKPEQLQKANRSIMFGLIGAVIVIGSFTILQIITDIVSEFTPT